MSCRPSPRRPSRPRSRRSSPRSPSLESGGDEINASPPSRTESAGWAPPFAARRFFRRRRSARSSIFRVTREPYLKNEVGSLDATKAKYRRCFNLISLDIDGSVPFSIRLLYNVSVFFHSVKLTSKTILKLTDALLGSYFPSGHYGVSSLHTNPTCR